MIEITTDIKNKKSMDSLPNEIKELVLSGRTFALPIEIAIEAAFWCRQLGYRISQREKAFVFAPIDVWYFTANHLENWHISDKAKKHIEKIETLCWYDANQIFCPCMEGAKAYKVEEIKAKVYYKENINQSMRKMIDDFITSYNEHAHTFLTLTQMQKQNPKHYGRILFNWDFTSKPLQDWVKWEHIREALQKKLIKETWR